MESNNLKNPVTPKRQYSVLKTGLGKNEKKWNPVLPPLFYMYV